MAEGLITSLVQQFTTLTLDEIALILNARGDVANFSSKLQDIQALLHDAEKKQVVEESVRRWLEKLKDVSFEMDDVVDEWKTEVGKREAHPTKNKNKVLWSFLYNCSCLGQFSNVTFRRHIACTIRDLNQELTQIHNERSMFNFQSTIADAVNVEPRPITSSFVDISTIFGREAEKDRLVSELIRGEIRRSDQLVIPIVGIGGLGKTTFTQLVFKDAQVQAHFDKKAWVCVSEPFDAIKIAKEILELVSGIKTQDSSNVLEKLLESIQEHIKDNKFLLVLDDVWTEDQTKWDTLNLPLIMQTCAKGSRLLVTTRNKGVAEIMRATRDMFILEKLSHSDSLKLFNEVAFQDREQDKSNKGFGDIADKIVRKCDGLPLVLKNLGSLMLHKETIREWEEVLNSETWKVEVVQEEVFRPLLLSYYDLAPEIKCCLLYCATFPKDFEFNKEMLIEQWMAQGYLNVGQNAEEATKGQEVFNKLVMRCFFQDFRKNALTMEIMGCKMHDTVHDFVQYLTQNECFTMKRTITHGIETSSANDVTKPPPGVKVRHLTLLFAREGPFPSSISSFVNCEILRTLASFDSRITTIDSNLIRQLKRLRTLNLRDNHIEQLPEEIGDLMHLRNIDLSCNMLRLLPDSVCNLYNLQTLRLDRCQSLAKLPNNMGKLINLKHLHVEFCISMRYLPKGIGSIRNLRTLDGRGSPCFYCSEHAKSLTFGDLRTMNQLRRLAIFIVGIREDAASMAEKAELRKKELLSHLDLYLSGYDGDVEGGLMDALQPHENLESLEIGQYNGSTWPTWMTTSYLTRLTVFHLGYCHSSVLPHLGKLPSLKVIKLMSMDCLREIGREFFGVTCSTTTSASSSSSACFPSLETLFLGDLSRFEKWELGGEAEDSCNSQMSIMPRLSSLHIVECPKLKQLPDFLLQNAPLQNAPLQNLLIDHCDSFGSLPDEFISRITNVTIIQYGVDPFIRGRKIDSDPIRY